MSELIAIDSPSNAADAFVNIFIAMIKPFQI
jgi:hypothetical protein